MCISGNPTDRWARTPRWSARPAGLWNRAVPSSGRARMAVMLVREPPMVVMWKPPATAAGRDATCKQAASASANTHLHERNTRPPVPSSQVGETISSRLIPLGKVIEPAAELTPMIAVKQPYPILSGNHPADHRDVRAGRLDLRHASR